MSNGESMASIYNFLFWLKKSYSVDCFNQYSSYMRQEKSLQQELNGEFIEMICKALEIPLYEVLGPRRTNEIVDVRRIISRHLKGKLSQRQIGMYLGARDHSSIHNLQQTYHHLYQSDYSFRQKAIKIQTLIDNK